MNCFEKEYNLRSNDFDCKDKISLSAILDLFQTAAGEHANLIGAGYTGLAEKNLIWVLTKVRLEILNQPERFSKVRVKTWPLTPGKITFRREYEITGEGGAIIVKGSSEWVTVDAVKRKIMPCGDIYNIKEYKKEYNFGEKLMKIRSFTPEDKGVTFSPSYSDIDINMHLNNTKYANYIMNAKNIPLNIKSFGIDYHAEIKQGEEFTVYVKEDGNKISCFGKKGDSVAFNAECEIMQNS